MFFFNFKLGKKGLREKVTCEQKPEGSEELAILVSGKELEHSF